MKEQLIANKDHSFCLYNLALTRIEECERIKGEIINFPKLFQKICRSFSIKKGDAWKLLYFFRDLQQIEIVPYHGIRLLNGGRKC